MIFRKLKFSKVMTSYEKIYSLSTHLEAKQ